jgi:hypothetical protein
VWNCCIYDSDWADPLCEKDETLIKMVKKEKISDESVNTITLGILNT